LSLLLSLVWCLESSTSTQVSSTQKSSMVCSLASELYELPLSGTRSKMEFNESFVELMKHEGGYSNHPADPGGETMWGMTARVARARGYTGPMKDLPQDLAKKWYRADYWDSVRADDLPPQLRYAMFDAAVNSGPVRAVQWLQQAIGVPDDGKLGPQTLGKLQPLNAYAVKCKMLGIRLDFMASLGTWSSFGRGWARRIASLLQH